MCSCSGSCNCNSTTIPRGPQGNQGNTGPQGLPGEDGAPGEIGPLGPPGVNSFTTLTAAFIQPAFDDFVEIAVENNSWVAINQIIYIPGGGFYKATDTINTTTIEIQKLDWTIPGISFTAPTFSVGVVGTLVTPSGTIGAPGFNSVERIKADVFQYNGLSPLVVNFTELDAIGKIITFKINGGTEDGTGDILSAQFSISNGVTTRRLFTIDDDAPNFGIYPAKIKFDKDPNTPPSGYSTNEFINFITADVKITRTSSLGGIIESTIYGYNKDIQATFGEARFTQKIWHLNTGFEYPANFDIITSVVGDNDGSSISITNILRYNTIL